METQRFSLTEPAVLVEEFTTLDTVTITLTDLSDGSSETLTSASCPEIGSSGFFSWPLSNITTYPTSFTEYLYVMSNGATTKSGKVVLYDADDMANGANQVTITVNDVDTDPIEGVEVQIYNSAQTLLIGKKDTNASGQVVFSLNDGSYKVRLYKSLVDFTVPEDLTVSGATATAYIGSLLTVTPGSGAGECEVSVFAKSQRPTISLASLTGTAQIINLPTELSGVYYPGQKVNGTYDSTNGRIYWILPRGSTVQFTIPDLGISGINAQKAIPSQASADYSDL